VAEEECSICLDLLITAEHGRTSQCNDGDSRCCFHVACLETAVAFKPECPLCRTQFLHTSLDFKLQRQWRTLFKETHPSNPLLLQILEAERVAAKKHAEENAAAQQKQREQEQIEIEKAKVDAETEKWRVATAIQRAEQKEKAAALSDDSAESVSPTASRGLQIQDPEREKADKIKELKAEIKDLQDKISSEKSEKSTGGSKKLTKLGKKMDAAVATIQKLDETWTPNPWLQKWLNRRK